MKKMLKLLWPGIPLAFAVLLMLCGSHAEAASDAKAVPGCP